MKLLLHLIPILQPRFGIDIGAIKRHPDIVDSILHGIISDNQQGADRHANGVKDTFEHYLNDVLNNILDILAGSCTKEFNPQQVVAHRIWARRMCVHKLLMIGERESGIVLAESTYHISARAHFFDVAADMADVVSRHYAQYEGDTDKGELYYKRYLRCREEDQKAKEALYYCGRYLAKLRKSKHVLPTDVTSLQHDINVVGLYADRASSYQYWHAYYRLQVFLYDAMKDYNQVYDVAVKGYDYFDKLYFDHRAAKLGMLSYQITGLIGMKKYQDAINLIPIVECNKSAKGNYRLCYMLIMRAYLNTGRPDKAEDIYNQYFNHTSSHKEIDDMARVYLIYALLMKGRTNIVIRKSYTRDNYVMGAAIRIAKAWQQYLEDPHDMPVHAYNRYLRRYYKKETRSSVFIKLMCTLPIREIDLDKYERRVLILMDKLENSARDPIEAEIIDYKNLWNIITKLENVKS